MPYFRIWRYEFAAGATAEFERAYGSAGDWARLFALAPGYLGTEFLQPIPPDIQYVTIDRWNAESDWNDFLKNHGAAYRSLGDQLAPLCVKNREVGNFASRD